MLSEFLITKFILIFYIIPFQLFLGILIYNIPDDRKFYLKTCKCLLYKKDVNCFHRKMHHRFLAGFPMHQGNKRNKGNKSCIFLKLSEKCLHDIHFLENLELWLYQNKLSVIDSFKCISLNFRERFLFPNTNGSLFAFVALSLLN